MTASVSTRLRTAPACSALICSAPVCSAPVRSAPIADSFRLPQAYVQALPWLLLIFVALYATRLTTFRIGVDSEFAALRHGNAVVWLREGRWGVYLIERFLCPQTTLPFLPLACFGAFASLGYLLLLRAHRVTRPGLPHYATFPLFVAFPTWDFLAAFPENIMAAGVGVALIGAAALLLRVSIDGGDTAAARPHPALLLAAQAALSAIAVSLYQSFLMMHVVIGLGVIVMAFVHRPGRLPALAASLAQLALAVLAGLLAYAALWIALMRALGVGPAYIDGLWAPGALFDNPRHVIFRAAMEAAHIYAGGAAPYGMIAWTFPIVPPLGLLALGLTRRLSGRPALRCLLLAIAAATIFVPFALNLFCGGWMEFRSLVSVPAAMWFLAFLAIETGGKFLSRAALAATALVTAQTLYIDASFQAADAIARHHDETLAAAIYTRIAASNPDIGADGRHTVEFFGAPPEHSVFPRPATSTIGASVFAWDGGGPSRIAALFTALGYGDFVAATPAQRPALLPEFAGMHPWPAPDSVRVIGDVTLVKLGNTPGHDPAPAGILQ